MWRWLSLETCFLYSLCSLYPWRYSKDIWMWSHTSSCWCFSLSREVELDGLRGPFQHQPFCKLWYNMHIKAILMSVLLCLIRNLVLFLEGTFPSNLIVLCLIENNCIIFFIFVTEIIFCCRVFVKSTNFRL